MKRGLIVVNAYTRSEAELNQPQRLREELSLLGAETEIVRNSPELLEREGDFCIYLDKDKYYARMLSAKMRLFNRAEAIEVCDDKMLTYLALGGFPQPRTVPSLLCYTENVPVSRALLRTAEGLGFPLVVKECFGSLGNQVYLAHDRDELLALTEKLRHTPHIFQKFVEESAGRDLRVLCVGGETAACMLRENSGDFRSNLSHGGKGVPFEPTEEIRSLARSISERLRLDYCGIDLLFGREGLLVCEVNSNAFFGGIEKVTGVNIARQYAKHILSEI